MLLPVNRRSAQQQQTTAKQEHKLYKHSITPTCIFSYFTGTVLVMFDAVQSNLMVEKTKSS